MEMKNPEQNKPKQILSEILRLHRPQLNAISPELESRKKHTLNLNDRFLRLAADFENFKKRTERDQERIIALANERFAGDVLEVVDNLERAQKTDDSHLREGITQIQQLLDPCSSGMESPLSIR